MRTEEVSDAVRKKSWEGLLRGESVTEGTKGTREARVTREEKLSLTYYIYLIILLLSPPHNSTGYSADLPSSLRATE